VLTGVLVNLVTKSILACRETSSYGSIAVLSNLCDCVSIDGKQKQGKGIFVRLLVSLEASDPAP
jgi:hypothetical protein